MKNDIKNVLFSEEQLDEICKRLGKQISEDYKGKELVLVCVLKGSIMFMSDLMKNISIPCTIDFIEAKSYGKSTISSGEVKITKDLSDFAAGKHLLIVEDILDSGRTLKKLITYLQTKEPASVKIATLLDKPSRRVVDIEADYTGSEVGDEFVVGYGLDCNQMFRNLPYIGVLTSEAINRLLT